MAKAKSANKSKGPRPDFKVRVAEVQFAAHYKAGRFAAALTVLQGLMGKGHPNAAVYADAAVCAVYTEQWEKAVSYGRAAIMQDPKKLNALDALAHACAPLGDWEGVRTYGSRALQVRADSVAGVAPLDLPLLQGAGHVDVISLSLFGGNSKYCETAILNAVDQPVIYPDWEVWVYHDETVPEVICQRLADAGATLIAVDEELAKWPGPMWRFAAIDDPRVRYLNFRDADSVISTREAGAVAEWIESGKPFHMMRDMGSHTELMLAGLWGARRGTLPRMRDLVAKFLEKPVQNAHFADQFFLREYVWPFARTDMLEHDSVYGWAAGGRDFPDGPRPDDFHVGYAEGVPLITITTKEPEGAAVEWFLLDRHEGDAEICRYPAQVRQGVVKANVPARFAKRIQAGTIRAGLDNEYSTRMCPSIP